MPLKKMMTYIMQVGSSEKTQVQSDTNGELQREIKKTVTLMASCSSLHGLPHLVKADTKWKMILWLFFFALYTSLFIYLTCKDFTEYLSWPVTTTIRFKNEQEVEFPGVAICNVNPFVTDKGVEFLVEFIENQTNHSYQPAAGNQTKIEFVNENFFYDPNSDYIALKIAYYNRSEAEKKSFGLPLENMLVSCEFDGKPCDSSNWTWLNSYYNGNCYIFNGDTPRTIKSINKDSGLVIELFAGHEEKIPFFKKTSGFQIFLFNHTKYLKMEYYIPRVSIQAGSEVNIEIYRRFIQKLPKPYSECDLDLNTATIDSVDSELYRELFLTNKSYEQYYCFHLAFRKTVFTRCNCVVEIGDVKEPAHICATKEEQDCQIYVDQILFQTRQFDGTFDVQCPLECNSIELEMTMSSENFPSYSYGQYLLENNVNFNESSTNKTFDMEDVRSSVAKINLYYTKIGRQTLEENASMTIINLLANTGGMLGLFLGMSLLTLIEGFQVLTEILFMVYRHKYNHNIQL